MGWFNSMGCLVHWLRDLVAASASMVSTWCIGLEI